MENPSIQQLEISAANSGLGLNPLRLFHDRNGRHSTEVFEAPDHQRPSHELSIADFVKAVRDNTEPTVPAAHGVPSHWVRAPAAAAKVPAGHGVQPWLLQMHW